MFWALNGATRQPRRLRIRQKAVAAIDLPTSLPVPRNMMAPAFTGVCPALSLFVASMPRRPRSIPRPVDKANGHEKKGRAGPGQEQVR